MWIIIFSDTAEGVVGPFTSEQSARAWIKEFYKEGLYRIAFMADPYSAC